jgi:hypothetical protein
MKNKSLVWEFWEFLKIRKAWWFILIILMLLIAGVFMISVQSSSLSPFIYALF